MQEVADDDELIIERTRYNVYKGVIVGEDTSFKRIPAIIVRPPIDFNRDKYRVFTIRGAR